jgi:hypothetical protein
MPSLAQDSWVSLQHGAYDGKIFMFQKGGEYRVSVVGRYTSDTYRTHEDLWSEYSVTAG